MSYSTTYLANIIQILMWASTVFGWNITQSEWETTTKVVLAVVSGLYVFYERWSRGDLKWFGGRLVSK